MRPVLTNGLHVRQVIDKDLKRLNRHHTGEYSLETYDKNPSQVGTPLKKDQKTCAHLLFVCLDVSRAKQVLRGRNTLRSEWRVVPILTPASASIDQVWVAIENNRSECRQSL